MKETQRSSVRVERKSLACPLLHMGLLSVLADWKPEDKAAWEWQFPDIQGGEEAEQTWR